MGKYAINYAELESSLDKPKVYRYSEVKDRLTKVAFDVYKFKKASSRISFECDSEDIDGLWKIQQSDDGDIIVAMYQEGDLVAESDAETGLVATASRKVWDVVPASDGTAHIFYKEDMVRKLASSELGISGADLEEFCPSIATKLASDGPFRKALLKDISKDKKEALLSKYPELTK